MTNFCVKDSGQRENFTTGSRRDTDTGKPRYDLISHHANTRAGVHMAKGANKYGERNWELGQPVSRFLASAMRHLEQYRAGYRDEDHLAAVRFNVDGIMHMEEEVAAGRLPVDLLDLWFYKNFEHVAETVVKWVGRMQLDGSEVGVNRAEIEEMLFERRYETTPEQLTEILLTLKANKRLHVYEDGQHDPLWQVIPVEPDWDELE